MSVLIDANESEEYDYLLGQMGIETRRGNYNQSPGSDVAFPDFVVVNGDVIGVNNKAAVEAMADLDAVEEQLRRELRTVEKLVFCYRGALTWAEEGTYAGDAEYLRVKHQDGQRGNEYETLASRGRVLHQPHARWTAFQWRLQDAGIPVVSTGNVRGTAAFLHTLHAGHSNTLFRRLIRVRQEVMEDDPKLRVWKLFLMGIPGVGPEAAVCLADVFPNMTQLVALLSEGGHIKDIPLPAKEGVRGRKIGPELERKVAQFLGMHVQAKAEEGAR